MNKNTERKYFENIDNIDYSKYKTEIISNYSKKIELFAKVEIVGDSKVGKSSIILRATKNIFNSEIEPTVGYNFTPFTLKIDDSAIKLQLWDMCGANIYRNTLLNLFRNAVLGILVYSVNDRQTFDNLENWIRNLRNVSKKRTRIILIGNKNDLKREVSYEEGKKFAEKNDLPLFFELSCKDEFPEPNFLVLISILLYHDYITHKDDNSDQQLDYTKNESIMLEIGNKNVRRGCC